MLGVDLDRASGEGQPEALGAHGARVNLERDALHHVAELADVLRPRVRPERRARVVAERLRRDPIVLARSRQEALGEDLDVAGPGAQGRQMEGHDGEPAVQVLAEALLPHGGLQVLVGRRDDRDVHHLVPRRAEPAHGPLVEGGEELGLERNRHEADLVEEQHAAVGRLEEARLGLLGIGEGAALEAEQLALEHRLRDRRAVEIDERPGRAWAGAMDQPGQLRLAGAGLALDQDGREPPEPRHALEQSLNSRRSAPIALLSPTSSSSAAMRYIVRQGPPRGSTPGSASVRWIPTGPYPAPTQVRPNSMPTK